MRCAEKEERLGTQVNGSEVRVVCADNQSLLLLLTLLCSSGARSRTYLFDHQASHAMANEYQWSFRHLF